MSQLVKYEANEVTVTAESISVRGQFGEYEMADIVKTLTVAQQVLIAERKKQQSARFGLAVLGDLAAGAQKLGPLLWVIPFLVLFLIGADLVRSLSEKPAHHQGAFVEVARDV